MIYTDKIYFIFVNSLDLYLLCEKNLPARLMKNNYYYLKTR